MHVHLSQELDALVKANVRTGRYNSASEVDHKALRLLAQREDLRHRMDRALDESSRSAGTDGEAFLQAMRDDLAVAQKAEDSPPPNNGPMPESTPSQTY